MKKESTSKSMCSKNNTDLRIKTPNYTERNALINEEAISLESTDSVIQRLLLMK